MRFVGTQLVAECYNFSGYNHFVDREPNFVALVF